MMLPQILRRSHWATLLKIVVAAAIVVAIWRLNIINITMMARILSQPLAAALAVAAIAAAIQLSVVRWYILLKVHGQNVSIRRLTSIVFTSYFLGSTTFGTLGIDALRLYYIGRERPDSVGQAYLSIAADRLIGLFGLILTGGLLFALNYTEVMHHREMRPLVLISLVVAAGILALAGALVAFDRYIAPLLEKVSSFGRLRTHFGLLVRSYGHSLGSIGACLAISLLVQLLMLTSLLVLTHAILSPALSLSQLGLAGVGATIANQVPITPGGLAIGESMFAYLCRLMDPVSATLDYGSVIFLQRLLALVATLPGLLLLFVDRRAPEKL